MKKYLKQAVSITFIIFAFLLCDLTGIAATLNVQNISDGVSFYGDVNSDGKITAKDSLIVLRSTIKLIMLDDFQTIISDVIPDGKISAADALEILRYTIGFQGKGITGTEYHENHSIDHNTSSAASKNDTSSAASKNDTSSVTSNNDTSSKNGENNYSDNTTTENTNSMSHGYGEYTIVLNTKTKKYHTTHCRSVDKILPENRFIYYVQTFGGTQADRRYIESFGYVHCKLCER